MHSVGSNKSHNCCLSSVQSHDLKWVVASVNKRQPICLLQSRAATSNDFKTSMQSLQKVEASSTLCNLCKPKKVQDKLLRLRLHGAILMLRYCVSLKAIRYESKSLNRIVADKSHDVIVAYGYNYTVRFIAPILLY